MVTTKYNLNYFHMFYQILDIEMDFDLVEIHNYNKLLLSLKIINGTK